MIIVLLSVFCSVDHWFITFMHSWRSICLEKRNIPALRDCCLTDSSLLRLSFFSFCITWLLLRWVFICLVCNKVMAATIIISETNILALVITTSTAVKYLLQAVTTIKFLLPLLSSQNVIVASDISTNLVLAVLSSQVHWLLIFLTD